MESFIINNLDESLSVHTKLLVKNKSLQPEKCHSPGQRIPETTKPNVSKNVVQ